MVSEDLALRHFRRLVDGVVLPIRRADNLALDFCNTLAGWGEPEPLDYLRSYAHLAVWAKDAGVLADETADRLLRRARRDPAEAAGVLMRARSLREALYAAATDRTAAAAWDAVAAEARLAAATSRLDPAARPGARWLVSGKGLDLPLLELGRAAGDFLATADLDKVRRCPGTQCGWLFLDPRGRRRWCTMAVCGNRAKARRHAQRARAQH